VKCVDLTLTVLYIILLSVFLGWGLYYRTRKRKTAYRTKSVSNVISGGQLHSRNQEKDENLPMHQVHNRMLFLYYEHMFGSIFAFLNNFCFLSFLPSLCMLVCPILILFWPVVLIIRLLKMFHKTETKYDSQLCKDTCQIFTGHCLCYQLSYQLT